MSATPLPPTGQPPLDGPKTCDASGMIEIHRMFRHSFDEASGLVAGVLPGDLEHADAVAAQLELIRYGLEVHHHGEDDKLWEAIDARAPQCTLHVARLRRQHEAMQAHLAALAVALPSWREDPSPMTAAPVRAAVEAVAVALAEHFPDEEANVVPVMEHVLTEKENAWFEEHGRRSTPRGQMWNVVGSIAAAQPDGDAWIKANLPGPVRLLWHLVGARRFARFRQSLAAR